MHANSLSSLATLAKLKGWQLDVYVRNIPCWLKESPNGDSRAALALDANIIEADKSSLGKDANLDSFMRFTAQYSPGDTLFIPKGGRCRQALNLLCSMIL